MMAHEGMTRRHDEHNWRTRILFVAWVRKISHVERSLAKPHYQPPSHVGITLTPHPKADLSERFQVTPNDTHAHARHHTQRCAPAATTTYFLSSSRPVVVDLAGAATGITQHIRPQSLTERYTRILVEPSKNTVWACRLRDLDSPDFRAAPSLLNDG
jgi:hypothetical protein